MRLANKGRQSVWFPARLAAWLCAIAVGMGVSSRPAIAHQNAEPPTPPSTAEPGVAEEILVDRGSGVSTAWLSNGVLVHHKVVETKGEEAEGGERGRAEVVVTIAVAGGELLETAANRGISRCAATAWQRPSTRSMAADEIERYLSENNVRLRGWAGADAMTLRITAPPGSIEAGLKVARLLLTEPMVDEKRVERWKRDELEGAGRQRRRGERVVFDAAVEMLFAPEEVRTRPASAEAVDRLTAAEAQAWLDGMLIGGKAGWGAGGGGAHPIEAAIVGDIEARDAIALAERYLGPLPRRDRIGRATFAASRVAKPAGPGPVVSRRTVEGANENPYVVAGFFGADIADLDDYRALSVAARILTARMSSELPGAENIGGDAAASSLPASVYPGFGLVLAATEVEPDREESAMKLIEGMLAKLREAAASDEEVSVVKGQMVDAAARLLEEAQYWSGLLAVSTYHGVAPAALARAEQAYRDMTPERVLAAVRQYDREERRIRVIVEAGGGARK